MVALLRECFLTHEKALEKAYASQREAVKHGGNVSKLGIVGGGCKHSKILIESREEGVVHTKGSTRPL